MHLPPFFLKKNSTLIPSLVPDNSALLSPSSGSTTATSGGTVAGAVVGSVAGAALIAGGAFLLIKRYKRGVLAKQRQTELDNEDFYADPFQQNMQWHNNADGYDTTGYIDAEPVSAIGQGQYMPAPNQQSMDEVDEYGHRRNNSFWSTVSGRLR
jgi:hypothetical protein